MLPIWRQRPPSCLQCPCEPQPHPGLGEPGGFIQSEGTGALRVLMAGEGPGDKEYFDGLPFRPYAPAGSVLERAIRLAGFNRDQFAITNLIRCQPKRNWLSGAPWEEGAIARCRPYFDQEMARFKPAVILALGGLPLEYLAGVAGEKQAISLMRGYVLRSIYPDVWLVSTFHPSYLRRGGKQRDEETGAKTGGGAGKGGMHLLGVLIRDIQFAVQVAREGWSYEEPKYDLYPSLDDARSFYYRAKDNSGLVLSCDVENPKSGYLDEEELEQAGGGIIQIQFSLEKGTGTAFPWLPGYIEIARDLLALPNDKLGHNIRFYDAPVLQEAGCQMTGRIIDTMEMWRKAQPDLPAGLQFVASFCGFPFAWKHLFGSDIRRYGCCDVDAPHRIREVLEAGMKVRGIWRSYDRHVLGLRPVLDRMSGRGIPIDDGARLEFGEDLDKLAAEIEQSIQSMVPLELRPGHPKQGYKKVPKDVMHVLGGCELLSQEETDRRVFEQTQCLRRKFHEFVPKEGDPLGELVETERWIRTESFNTNSADQLIAYMRLRGHKVPKHPKTGEDTTLKLELAKLAKQTGDPIYRVAVERREITKLRGTYVRGWQPGEDGRIHSTYYDATGTGQLNSRRPNAQNSPRIGKDTSSGFKTLAKRFRGLVRAEPGHRLVEFDYKSMHALTLGFEARDPDYMRIARIDMHSFLLAGGLKRVWTPEELLALPDDELRERMRWVKKNHGEERDIKAKPAILGYGFAMGPRTLFNNNPESFKSQTEAAQVIRTLDRLFPKQPLYRQRIRRLAADQHFLVSRHGYIRWFWDVAGDDAEACVAFLPANDAHGHLKDAMLRLEELGWLERAQLANQIHDALFFHMPIGVMDDAIPAIKAEMERRSEVLVDPVVAPDGLWIEVEVKVGDRWSEMEEIHA